VALGRPLVAVVLYCFSSILLLRVLSVLLFLSFPFLLSLLALCVLVGVVMMTDAVIARGNITPPPSLRGQQQQPRVSGGAGRRRGPGEADGRPSGCCLHPHHPLPAGAGWHTGLLEVHTHTHTHTHTCGPYICLKR